MKCPPPVVSTRCCKLALTFFMPPPHRRVAPSLRAFTSISGHPSATPAQLGYDGKDYPPCTFILPYTFMRTPPSSSSHEDTPPQLGYREPCPTCAFNPRGRRHSHRVSFARMDLTERVCHGGLGETPPTLSFVTVGLKRHHLPFAPSR